MIALLVALALAAASPPPVTFNDPQGDSGTAPDIVKTTVATDGSKYFFTFTFVTPYGDNSNLLIYLDTDQNKSTGDPNGFDYLLQSGSLEMWDATAQDFEPVTSEPFAVTNGGLTVVTSVNLADIGNAKAFDFEAQSLDGAGGVGHMDTTAGQWTGAGASPFQTAGSHQSQANGKWSVEVSALGSSTIPAGTKGAITCKGKAGKKALAVARKLAIPTANGVNGVCVFTVPKAAKHKKLTAAVTVSIAGSTAAKTFTTTAK